MKSSDSTARTGSGAAKIVIAATALSLVSGARGQSSAPPSVAVLLNAGGLASGYIFIGPQDISNAPIVGPEILDNQGRMVWFMPMAPGYAETDFRVQNYLGNPVLTWIEPTSIGKPTVDYIMDATYKVVATVQANGFNADEHEFQLTPENTALIDIYNTVPADLSSVGGSVNGMVTEGVVQEINVATGAVIFEWHSLNNVPITESYAPLPSTGPYDYFHLNSVKLDTDGNLLISSRHTWTVYKVNRTTGAIIWRLGGKKSDFALGSGLPFAWQHDAEAVDASTLRLFDNESNGATVLPYSRALFVHHDDTAMTASVVQAYVHPDALSVPAEGSAQSLDNGDVFVEWGALGRYSEFNASGQLIYDAAQAPGYGSYRGFRFSWTATPATSPTATAFHRNDGTDTVHALWNGATQVATWEVMAGASAGNLTLATTAPWNGLDTAIQVPGGNGAYQVAALDATGTMIGSSAVLTGPFADVFPAQPASQTVSVGSTVVLTAAASGASPAYVWFLNGAPISDGPMGAANVSGANTSTLVIAGTDEACAGSYTCSATVLGNTSTSAPATVILSSLEPGLLINASCRAVAGPGQTSLIIGFAVGGRGTGGPLPLLVRATGPTLSQFGVTDALADPLLQLFDSGELIGTNTGWSGDAGLASLAV